LLLRVRLRGRSLGWCLSRRGAVRPGTGWSWLLLGSLRLRATRLRLLLLRLLGLSLGVGVGLRLSLCLSLCLGLLGSLCLGLLLLEGRELGLLHLHIYHLLRIWLASLLDHVAPYRLLLLLQR
jgi:hypothetical protein